MKSNTLSSIFQIQPRLAALFLYIRSNEFRDARPSGRFRGDFWQVALDTSALRQPQLSVNLLRKLAPTTGNSFPQSQRTHHVTFCHAEFFSARLSTKSRPKRRFVKSCSLPMRKEFYPLLTILKSDDF